MVQNREKSRSFKIHLIEFEDGTVVNIGFKPMFEVGQTIALEVEEKFGELKMVGTSIRSDVVEPKATTYTPKKEYSSGRNTKFPIPKDHGDFSIIRQNALTNAVNYFNNSGMKPATFTNEERVEEIIKIAYKFAEFSSGHREQRLSKEVGKAMLGGSEKESD